MMAAQSATEAVKPMAEDDQTPAPINTTAYFVAIPALASLVMTGLASTPAGQGLCLACAGAGAAYVAAGLRKPVGVATESPEADEDAPRKVYASDDCVICLDALPQAEAQPLRCGHTFHPHCIAEWCSRSGGAGGGAPRCPTCMQPISWRRALVDRALLVA